MTSAWDAIKIVCNIHDTLQACAGSSFAGSCSSIASQASAHVSLLIVTRDRRLKSHCEWDSHCGVFCIQTDPGLGETCSDDGAGTSPGQCHVSPSLSTRDLSLCYLLHMTRCRSSCSAPSHLEEYLSPWHSLLSEIKYIFNFNLLQPSFLSIVTFYLKACALYTQRCIIKFVCYCYIWIIKYYCWLYLGHCHRIWFKYLLIVPGLETWRHQSVK